MLAIKMSERIAKDKMKKYLDEAFSLNCVFTKNIILVRYQTSRRSMFHRGQKLIGPEEFRENVLEEFEKGVSSLQSDVSEELQVMA
ncbi:MAG: hypothetical protein QG670_1840 [Thermoproteota archaeon]|nr:hypothetical protein [Thermoproteota archaeon]